MGLVLALRFLLELALFASIAWWGSQQLAGVAGVVLAVGLVAAFAVAWGLLVSPKARVRMPSVARVVVEVALFGLGAMALADLGRPLWGVVLLLVDLAIIGALAALRDDATEGWSPHDVQRGRS